MVGQQHIERTLRNAVASDNVAHAYLFTGPRGTGKTTTARLLAKALMCKQGPTDTPDGTCEACLEINEGNHPDVIELDAASRNGVEAVRTEIIERVYYAPQRGNYKVYIIDEVHMLSTAAFNAMLKTLEEPPSHVVFVLCTTDPQKVPATIQSRCQRFDFHPISSENIAERLRFIAQSEGIKIDNAALSLIAKHAEGGLRDAITTLEQLAAYTADDISVDDVEGVLGEVSAQALAELLRSIAQRDTATGFLWIANQVEMGADLPELVKGVIAYVRDMYVLAILNDVDSDMLLTITSEDRPAMEKLVKEFEGPARIARIISLLSEVSGAMRYSTEPRTLLEVALVRMSRPESELTLEALSERIERLEAGGVRVVAPQEQTVATPKKAQRAQEKPSPSAPEPSPESAQAAQEAVKPEAAPEPLEAQQPEMVSEPEPVTFTSEVLNPESVKRSWIRVVGEIKKAMPSRAPFFANTKGEMGADGTIKVSWPANEAFLLGQAKGFPNLMKNALEAVFGKEVPFTMELADAQVSADPEPTPVPEPAPAAPIEPPAYEEVPEDIYLESAPAEIDAAQEADEDDTEEPVEPLAQPTPAEPDIDDADVLAALSGLGVITEDKDEEDNATLLDDNKTPEETFTQMSFTQDYMTDPDEE